MTTITTYSGPTETFDPASAHLTLSTMNFKYNRPISQKWVEYLARQMTDGLWRLNGEAIIFDEHGRLMNGQHRLGAVIQSGKTITFPVVRGVKASTFTTMDQNRVRSAGQVLGMKGEKHGFLLAAVCRKLYCWQHEGHVGGKMKISPDELSTVLKNHPDLRVSCDIAQRITSHVPVDGSMVAFCHWLFEQSNAKRAASFFNTLETGVSNTPGDPAMILRERFFKERKENHRRWSGTELLAIFARAWNYYAKGETVSKLAIKPDKDGTYQIPSIYGLGAKQGGKGSLRPPAKIAQA